MAAWYWFVIAGVAVVVIGGTIFLLTRGGDEEEAAAMEKAEMRSLEELAKDGIQLAVDGSEMFMAPEDPESGYEWLMHSTCEDIAEIESAFKAPGDEKDAEEKDGDDEDEDKKDSAKSLQKDDEDAEEDEEAEDEDAEKKADTGARHWTVTGVAEGECELKLAHADKEKFDWEDEDTWEEAKEIVKIAITVGEAGEGDDEEKKGDDKEEAEEEEE